MHVLHSIWNLIRGGSEGQCAQTANRLTVKGVPASSGNCAGTCGCRVAVFRKEGFYFEAVQRTCGPVYHFDIRHALSLHTWRCIRKLADFIREERIDVLHAWDMDAVIYGCAAARMAGIPFITSRRDMGVIYPRYKLRLASYWDRRAQAVVVNARAIGDKLVAGGLPSDKICCIDNLLDIGQFDVQAGSAEAAEGDVNTIRLICVARLDPEKDIATLIKAFAAAARQRSGMELTIAGDGDERGALERLAVECGVGECVHFTGDITDVSARLIRADIGLLTPSRNEGLSNSIMEYMSARLPVIATDCGGNAELIDHEQGGYIVPVGNVNAMADVIVRLAENPGLRRTMGEYNRSQAEQRFDPDRVVRQYRELYESVLAQKC